MTLLPFTQNLPLVQFCDIASKTGCSALGESMKRFLIVAFTALLIFSSVVCLAGDGVLRNASNAQIGKVESDGTVRDRNNAHIGKIHSDGTIRNSSGAAIGKLESNGTFRDARNSFLGKIESDGTVRNSNNARIGKIENNGVVRNANGAAIGKASGVKKEWAAVFFFFHFK